jgi:hypothetical protein
VYGFHGLPSFSIIFPYFPHENAHLGGACMNPDDVFRHVLMEIRPLVKQQKETCKQQQKEFRTGAVFLTITRITSLPFRTVHAT